MKELQSLGLAVCVQDADGNEVDIKQTYDEDENLGFDSSELAPGDDVMVESELGDDYSIEEADEESEFGDEDDEDEEPDPEDLKAVDELLADLADEL